MRRFVVSLCAVLVLGLALPASGAVYYGDFDWRQNGGNFVTPIRNQSPLNSCWAFSAVAAVESQYLISAGTPGIDFNLSEQHLVCDAASGIGGKENVALQYIQWYGITDEAKLPYIGSQTSPLWPLQRPYTIYKATTIHQYIGSNRDTIKTWLRNTGPLSCAMHTNDWWNPATLGAAAFADGEAQAAVPELDFSLPEWLQGQEAPSSLGPDDPVGDLVHAVLIVGYKDVPSIPEGGYWIVKNSWGDWGDSGYGFLKYGDIEKYNRVHAVTGDVYSIEYPVPSPVALDDWYTTNEDTLLGVNGTLGVLANDTDIDTPLDQLTAIKFGDPAHGTLQLAADGSFTYMPNPDWFGTDTFQYRAFDGEYYSQAATVSIDVISVNDPPIAPADECFCDQDTQLYVRNSSGVLANDDDADNHDHTPSNDQTLSASLVSSVSHGSLAFYGLGGFLYTPAAGFFGVDSFTYRAFDGQDYSNVATVSIYVRGTNPVPGDVNGDGHVNEEDAAVLASNWGKAGGWLQGDFNDDGVVNALDAAIMAANWGDHTGGGEAATQAVPEPGSLAMGLGLLNGPRAIAGRPDGSTSPLTRERNRN